MLFSEEDQVIFRLETFVDANPTIYPSETIRIGYRYIFNRNFSLTKEEIPLLEANGFHKIGEKVFQDSVTGTITTVEISQVAETVAPGTYTFGPSEISGKSYTENAVGTREYSKEEYSAKASGVTIVVHPFPEKNKPASFNGAVGQFTMDVVLLTPAEMAVGDKILLQIKIVGPGEINYIPFPEICCQPGFSGFFKMSDLPPTEKIGDKSKVFVLEMRPQSESINEIPPIEFSFFNPINETYVTITSDPIPVKVHPLNNEPPVVPTKPSGPPDQAKTTEIEIQSVYPLSSFWYSNIVNEKLKFASSSYVEAEKTNIVATRAVGFNLALEIYTSLEKKLSSAKLYYNIANCYFQVAQYSLAIFYYNKALKLAPREPRILQNLEVAQAKQGLSQNSSVNYFSMSERLRVFYIVLGAAIVFFFINTFLFRIFSAITLICILSFMYTIYFVKAEGVIITSSVIYQDAGTQYAKVSEKPILAGFRVAVLDEAQKGTWLKIQAQDGTIGYVPSNNIRLF